MHLARIAPLGLLALASCGGLDKQPPIDLDAIDSPSANDFSAEDTLGARYESEILANWEQGTAGHFQGVVDVRIAYRVFEVANEKGAIVLLPGRTEPILKHAENILDLMNQGYSVYAMDHRGQGASERMLDNPQVGYVEYFKDYVDDLNKFVETVVREQPHSHLFLVAHSMGGGIGAMFMHKHPGVFDAAVLASPMLGINTGSFPSAIAISIATDDCGFSSGEGYSVGQADFDAQAKFTDESNDVTHSRARWDRKMQMYADNPKLRLGGVSYRWLCEALTATSHLVTFGADETTPILMFQAGKDDIVSLDAEDEYCGDAPRCQMQTYPGAFHEVLSEIDSVRNDALASAVRFLDHVAGSVSGDAGSAK